jgi:hypothetical protein
MRRRAVCNTVVNVSEVSFASIFRVEDNLVFEDGDGSFLRNVGMQVWTKLSAPAELSLRAVFVLDTLVVTNPSEPFHHHL